MIEGDWSDVRDQTSYSPEKFTPQVYQQVMSGKPRMEGARAVVDYFEVPDPEPGRGLCGPQAADGGRADRGRRVRGLPGRPALRPRGQERRDSDGGRLVLEERRAVPAPDPPRRSPPSRASTTTSSARG